MRNHLILYDGVCGLCNGFVHFVVARDHRNQFSFAPLQSEFAKKILEKTGEFPDSMDTILVLADFRQVDSQLANSQRAPALEKSTGVLFILSQLHGIWPVLGLTRYLPRILRDAVYSLVATYRYKMFGKYDVCPVPPPEMRARFVEYSSAQDFRELFSEAPPAKA